MADTGKTVVRAARIALGMAALAASGAACAQTSAQTSQPPAEQGGGPAPQAGPPKDGVAVPDTSLDPSIAKAPPATGSSTPVIKPPLSGPGDKTIVVPK